MQVPYNTVMTKKYWLTEEVPGQVPYTYMVEAASEAELIAKFHATIKLPEGSKISVSEYEDWVVREDLLENPTIRIADTPENRRILESAIFAHEKRKGTKP